MKMVKINIFLSFFLVFEIFFCVYSLIETWGVDVNKKEFEFVDVQITELSQEDPMLQNIEDRNTEDYHYYYVKLFVKNNYAEELRPLIIQAKAENGFRPWCGKIDYYSEKNKIYLIDKLPMGTEGFFDYILWVDNRCYEETEKMRFYVYDNEEKYIEAELPKE